MNLSEYTELDGVGLADLVRRGDVAPAELACLAAEAVDRVNPILNAVIETHDDRLEGDGRPEPSGGAFAGVPFMLKDITCTETGRLCEAGSRLLRGWRASDDTELMRRFRAAGLVNIGRTTTSEFAGAATVETSATGTTRNPWDVAYSTAGSSGGAAAAVASGVVPIAHGTDGGGSIRMPASCCGLVGLKPTRGRVSPAPAAPPPGDLSVEFALTRSVRDAAALLDAVAGSVAGDPYEIAPPSGSYVDSLEDRPRLRIAFSTQHLWDRRTDPEVAAAVERIARLCEDLGHHVEERRLRFGWEPYLRATTDVWGAMTAAGVRWAAAQTGLRPGAETLEGHTRAWDEHGRTVSAADLAGALEVLGAVTRDVARFFDDVDVFLTPTIPTLPIRLGEYDPDAQVAPGWYYDSAVGNLESTTSLFNCTGQPAVSLPLCHSAQGLPIGVHLAGRFGAEATLLGLSAALEEALPWRDRRAPIHAANDPATTGVTR